MGAPVTPPRLRRAAKRARSGPPSAPPRRRPPHARTREAPSPAAAAYPPRPHVPHFSARIASPHASIRPLAPSGNLEAAACVDEYDESVSNRLHFWQSLWNLGVFRDHGLGKLRHAAFFCRFQKWVVSRKEASERSSIDVNGLHTEFSEITIGLGKLRHAAFFSKNGSYLGKKHRKEAVSM